MGGIKFQFFIFLTWGLLGLGCQQSTSQLYSEADINAVPKQMESPQNDEDSAPDLGGGSGWDVPSPSTMDYTTLDQTSEVPISNEVQIPSAVSESPSSSPSSASQFIEKAHWVMVHEGKKIGTPCNYYLGRVLEVAGFPKDPFLAKNFDVYAKKNFASYKVVDFTADRNKSDASRLQKYLWSFPERTPFILEWTRPQGYGHVAIVERLGQSLIIYQASINRYTARRQQTSPEIILNSVRGTVVSVYSDFIARK